MELKFQKSVIDELNNLGQEDKHSILIEGRKGCGKTYLAKMYSTILGVDNFIVMKPSVENIRSIVQLCYDNQDKVVICIENLDYTTLKSSYTLLKFLEEPSSNAYVIITCSNMYSLPSTILSRSITLTVPNISSDDISEYAINLNRDKYRRFKSSKLWSCVLSLTDVNTIFNMKIEEVDYFNTELNDLVNSKFKDNVSNCVWKLSHYRDNSETPLDFVLRYILVKCEDISKVKIIDRCSRYLNQGRLSKHAILSKFVFEYKYGDTT